MTEFDSTALTALEELRQQGARERAGREAAEAQLRRLLDANLIGVCTCDLSGRVLEANDAFLRLIGSSREEMRGRALDLIELTPPAQRERARRARERVIEDGEMAPGEIELLRADGVAVPVLMAGARLPGRQTVVLFAQDLTESRRKEAAVRMAEARVSMLLRAMPVMLAEFDSDGAFTYVEGLERLGVPPSLSQSLLATWAAQPSVVELKRRALAGESVETRLQWRGRVFDVSLKPQEKVAGAGTTSVLCASVEVTDSVRVLEERRRLQDWLAQEHQLDGLGVLAAGLARSFNNLLAGVVANASSISQSLPPDHPSASALEDLLASSTRAAGLARQLLQSASDSPADARPLDLSKHLRDLAPLLSAAVPRGVRFDLELGAAIPPVRTHPDQLRRALVALLTGAIEATRASGGIVRVSTRLTEIAAESAALAGGDRLEPGWYVSVSVFDDGAPLSRETLDELADPLSTAQPGRRALGFAAVLGSMRAHRGGLRVKSEELHGTQVDLLYPISELAPQTTPIRAPRGPAASRQVMIVDDDPVVLRAASRILVASGLPVVTARGGVAALEQLRAGVRPGLVLLDFAMPEMNGEQTLGAIRQLQPELRVLLCSGYSQEEATWRIAPGLLTGFLPKPFTASDLLHAVLSALDGDGPAAAQG